MGYRRWGFNLSYIGGLWFEVANDYIATLNSYIDGHIEPWSSIDYDHEKESAFNVDLAKDLGGICLDITDISPPKQRQVEPCDVFHHTAGNKFIHVKRSTLSSGLSHLFMQGTNSYELLVGEQESRKKFAELLKPHLADVQIDTILNEIQNGQMAISFVITTHKDVSKGALALPLFSKISAYRTLRTLNRYRIPARISFAPDVS
mgnify:CR=1 FL=1